MYKELRYRMYYVVLGFVMCSIVGVKEREVIVYGVFKELNSGVLFNLSVLEYVEVVVRLVCVMGVMCSVPTVWLEVYGWINNGLTREEKRRVKVRMAGSWILLVLGVWGGMCYVIPSVEGFVNSVRGKGVMEVDLLGTMGYYYSFIEGVVLFMLLVSQGPVVWSIIGWEMKDVVLWRKVVYVCGLLLSGLISPPEVGSQLLVFIPVMVVLEVCIGMKTLRDHGRRKDLDL